MTIFRGRAPGAAIGSMARRCALTSGVAAVAALATTLTVSVPNLHATGAVGRAQTPTPTPQLTEQQKAEFIKSYEALPKVNVPLDAGTAKVLVVKFNDYQCPPCRQTYLDYKPIFAKWAKQAPGKVKFVTKDFALERECNAVVSSDVHPAACEAAVAVRLAREKGKAEAMEEWIFANQPSLTSASVRQAARDVGGVQDMDARYAATLDLVKGDTAQGAQLKVNSTPTFFMNGMRIPGLRPEFFDAAIAWELKRVGGGG
jgi:protein-disulfide isomerase